MEQGRPVRRNLSLTTGMKTTVGLIAAFIVFLVTTTVATILRLGAVEISVTLGRVVFTLLAAILLVFTWRRSRWAYLGTVLFGAVVMAATGPTAYAEQLSTFQMWQVAVLVVLGLLMALEGFKAYSELRQAKA